MGIPETQFSETALGSGEGKDAGSNQTVYLALANGKVFEGKGFGATGDITGELVFTTAMTGYLETLTDPSYEGQIVLQTFPLIGNYGVISEDFEKDKIGPSAYIVKYPSRTPSNFRNEGTLDALLKERGIIGLCDIDTRELTKIIRESGVMNGKIKTTPPTEEDFEEVRAHRLTRPVPVVSTQVQQFFPLEDEVFKVGPFEGTKEAALARPRHTLALLDTGAKENIRHELHKRGADVHVFPWDCNPEDILALKPDGIMLPNGPGDPLDNTDIADTLAAVIGSGIPIFGICLGHQLLALAHGFKTEKLKYGHRGSNQPVKDVHTGKVYITSQNHGYCVSQDSIDPAIAEEWIVSVNDGTNEGIIYKDAPIFSVQFHPEASGGPRDTEYLFDIFFQIIDDYKAGKTITSESYIRAEEITNADAKARSTREVKKDAGADLKGGA